MHKPRVPMAGYAVLALAIALVAAPDVLYAQGRGVTFRAIDGRGVSGLFFETGQRPSPAVVLVPMMGRPKEDWLGVAHELAAANIAALAIDGPGADASALTRYEAEVAGAVAFLRSQSADVRADAIGIAGASLGATVSVLVASIDPAVRSIALVSPSLDYHGARIETPFGRYGGRPALLMASAHDPYAARSVRALAHDAPVSHQIRWSEEAAHGTILLSRDPELVRALVEWFQATLGVS